MMILSSFLAVLLLLTSPLIVLTNILIISVWIRFKRLRTPSNFLILSLSLADLGFGLFLPAALAIDFSFIPSENMTTITTQGKLLPSPKSSPIIRHAEMRLANPSSRILHLLSIRSSENVTGNDTLKFNLPVASSHFQEPEELLLSTEDTVVLSKQNVQNYPPFLLALPFGFLLTFCACSLLSSCAIALDRFTSVAQPLRYNHFVTMTYVKRFVIVCWVYAAVVVVVPLVFFIREIPYKAGSIQLVVLWLTIFLYTPCVTVATLSYGYIYFVARSHARAIYSVEVSLNNCDVTDTAGIQHHRYGCTLAMIVGSIVTFWLPVQLCAIVDVVCGQDLLDVQYWRLALMAPIVLNSLLNPWLYGYRSAEIKLAIVRLVDSVLTKLTGKPPTINLLYSQHKELTSCASNVRLLTVSPSQTQTTVHCCNNNAGENNSKGNSKQIHLTICDPHVHNHLQVSTL